MRNKHKLDNKIIIILGPSASGKTDLALDLARELNKNIVSADSRQVYRGLDYSTGKLKNTDTFDFKRSDGYWDISKSHSEGESIEPEESSLEAKNNSPNKDTSKSSAQDQDDRKWIRYYGYDILNPNKEFSSGDFVEFSKNVVKKEKKTPIFAGGTGLYLSALTGKTSLKKVPRNTKLRKNLRKKTLKEIHNILEELGFDLSQLNNSEYHNKQRLIRKVEIKKTQMEQMDTDYTEKSFDILKITPEKEYLFIGLKKENYEDKIKKWINNNFEEIEKEVKWLKNKYPKSHLFKGFIFSEMKNFTDGKISKKEIKKQIKISYRQYIKRQMTYFNKYFPKAKWFQNQEEGKDYINNFK